MTLKFLKKPERIAELLGITVEEAKEVIALLSPGVKEIETMAELLGITVEEAMEMLESELPDNRDDLCVVTVECPVTGTIELMPRSKDV